MFVAHVSCIVSELCIRTLSVTAVEIRKALHKTLVPCIYTRAHVEHTTHETSTSCARGLLCIQQQRRRKQAKHFITCVKRIRSPPPLIVVQRRWSDFNVRASNDDDCIAETIQQGILQT